MKLDEIAERIESHLKRFESDPAINRKTEGVRRFYKAWAARGGGRVRVKYVAYQPASSLSKLEAMEYLDWLNDGNVGQHWEALR